MGIRSWISGKQYILINRTDGDTEVGTFPARRTVQQVKEMIAVGNLEDAVYRMICRSRKGDTIEWSMPKKKSVTPEQLSKMEQEKAIKALRDKTEEVKKGRDELIALRQQAGKIFGDDFGMVTTEIELPDESMGLWDAISRATAESAYVSIRQNPDKTTNALFGVVDAATGILTGVGNILAMKLADKTEKRVTKQIKTMEREVEIDGGKKVVKFKKPEPVMIDIEEEEEEEEELEIEKAPEEDEIEYEETKEEEDE